MPTIETVLTLCRKDEKIENTIFLLMVLLVLEAEMAMTHKAWPIKLSLLGINSERLRGL